MNRSRAFLSLHVVALLVCAGSLSLTACAPDAPPEDIVAQTDIVPVSLDSALAIESESLSIFDELHRRIERARHYVAATQPDSAAAELRRSTEMLTARSARAEGEVRDALQRAAAEGDRLARTLHEGASLADYELDDFTARSDIALAGFHLQRASLALDADRPATAGQHLKAAAALYELAALHGEGVTDDQSAVHDRMRETARWLEATNPDVETARRDLNGYVLEYDALRLQLAR